MRAKTHKDVEYMVDTADVTEYFKTASEAGMGSLGEGANG